MCRLLGYCTRETASVAEVLGERGLGDFTRLSAYHRHGWGLAWYRGPAAFVEKSSLRAADDPAYLDLARRELGDLGLAHLRRATPGLEVEAANSHPFRFGGYTMAHNGAIHPQDRLGDLLPPEWERHLSGNTDSERYFLRVLSRLDACGGDLVAAMADTAAYIDSHFSASSLNAVFLAPDALYAVCWYDPGSIPVGAVAQQGYSGPPECYFDLAYRQTPDAVVVASTGWQQDGWTVVPNRHVLVVDRATLRAAVHPLTAADAPAVPADASSLDDSVRTGPDESSGRLSTVL
jgi:predicted glutamine amidotransferase